MGTKLEDGIWEFEDRRNFLALYYVKDGLLAVWSNNDGPMKLGSAAEMTMKPLRRIATLDGKPVVDEGVVEAIVEEWFCNGDPMTDPGGLTRILRKHLCPSKQEQGAEQSEAERLLRVTCEGVCQTPIGEQSSSLADIALAIESAYQDTSLALGYVEHDRDRLQARITELEARPTIATYRENATGDEWVFLPLGVDSHHYGLNLATKTVFCVPRNDFAARFSLQPPADDAPIVRFEGAFVCWSTTTGEKFSAWPSGEGMRVLRVDGHASAYHAKRDFVSRFTRTRPIPLSPEHEATLAKLKPYLSDEAGARLALAEVKG